MMQSHKDFILKINDQCLSGYLRKEDTYTSKRLHNSMIKAGEGGNLRFSGICICFKCELDDEKFDDIYKIVCSLPEEPEEHNLFPKTNIGLVPPIQVYRKCIHTPKFSARAEILLQMREERLSKTMKMIENKSEKWAKDLFRSINHHGLPFSKKEKSLIKISILIDSEDDDEPIPEKELIANLKEISDMIASFENSKIHLEGYICPSYLFNLKNFQLANNLKLPTDFFMPEEYSSRIGQVKMTGLSLGLTNSPIGLTSASLDVRGDSYIVSLKVEYKLDKYTDSIRLMIEHSYKIAKEFVVEKNV